MRSLAMIVCLFTIVVLIGCGVDLDPPRRELNSGTYGVTTDTADTAGQSDPTPTPSEEPERPRPPQGGQRPPQNGQRPPENYDERRAEPGVDRRGTRYGGGFITEPVSQYWGMRESMTFKNIEHAMNLYNATNGNYPRTHQEFMEQIIQPGRISLPPLHDGETYFYDPESHELKVRKPR
jgi:hypothetical protein